MITKLKRGGEGPKNLHHTHLTGPFQAARGAGDEIQRGGS